MPTKIESSVLSASVNKALLDFRIILYSLCLVHHVYVGIVFLQIDFSTHEDPKIRMYHYGRWKLFTSWFNLVYLAYLPLCLYCDWNEKLGRSKKHVEFLGKARNALFTTILFPVTLHADSFFWRVYTKDHDLIAPKSVNYLIPWYSQHSMHTLTLILAVLDLICVPRTRPKSLLPGLIGISSYLLTYTLITFRDISYGIYIYPFLGRFSYTNLIVFTIYCIIDNYFFYTVQWCIIDFIWRKKQEDKTLVIRE